MSLTGILIVAAAYITLGWLIAKSPMITSIASRYNLLRTVDWMLLIVIALVLVLYGVILAIVVIIGRALGGVK